MTQRRRLIKTARVLQYLAEHEGPVYGYPIAKATKLEAGTVSSILRRLEEDGVVVGVWEESTRPGARRRYYTLKRDLP